MASIKAKPNGTYLITVSLGRDRNQKQLFERITFKPTKTTPKAIEKEVQQFANDFEKKVKEGEFFSGEKITFKDFMEVWEKNWAVDHLTQSVREGYVDILERRVLPVIGSLKISKISASHIQNIYLKMRDEGKAPKTIRRTHTAINSVFRYAYKMGVVQENVCNRCEMPKLKTDTDLHYYTVEQAKKLLSLLTQDYTTTHKAHTRTLKKTGESYIVPEYIETHHIPTQWKSYFTLAIYGGFRRGEMVALTWEDIDFEKETISINKAVAKTKTGQIIKETKTVAGNREIKMPSSCFSLLKEWKLEQMGLSMSLGEKWTGYRGKSFDKNWVYIQLDSGARMDVDTPSHKFKSILNLYNSNCENEEDKLPIIRLHDLRHTSATLLLSQNVDIETVSHRMGHSKASITLDVYGHWLKETDEKASNVLNQMFAM